MASKRDRQWSGDVELEFVTDASGEGHFVLSGSVVGTLRRLISQGQVLDAARTLSQCNGDVGDDLVEEIAEASAATRANVVQMFVEARDFLRAARCCERFGDHARAGDLFERGGHLDRAATAFVRAGELERAAQVLERDLEFEKAADFYSQARRFLKAAQSYERAGRYFAAGEIYMRLAKWPKAAEVLQRVGAHEPDYLRATLFLGKLLAAARQPLMAAQAYRVALQAHGLREDTLEVQYRLATVLAESDRASEAARLFRDLEEVHPGYRDVPEQLRALPARDGGRGVVEAITDLVVGEPPMALDVVSLEADVEFLRRVPLFADLSQPELHDFLPHWETESFEPSAVVLREGDDGRKLFIIKRGRARVLQSAGSQDERLLRILDEGSHFGELSLMRDRPATATVIADGPLTVLALDRATFERLLAASDRFAARIYRVFLHTLIDRFIEVEASIGD